MFVCVCVCVLTNSFGVLNCYIIQQFYVKDARWGSFCFVVFGSPEFFIGLVPSFFGSLERTKIFFSDFLCNFIELTRDVHKFSGVGGGEGVGWWNLEYENTV